MIKLVDYLNFRSGLTWLFSLLFCTAWALWSSTSTSKSICILDDFVKMMWTHQKQICEQLSITFYHSFFLFIIWAFKVCQTIYGRPFIDYCLLFVYYFCNQSFLCTCWKTFRVINISPMSLLSVYLFKVVHGHYLLMSFWVDFELN